jgi:hypothetical protein
LAAGVGLGAVRFREKREQALNAQPDQVFIPASVPDSLAAARAQRALGDTVALSPPPAPLATTAGKPPAAPTASQASGPASRHIPPAPPAPPAPAAPPAHLYANLQQQLDELREANADLAARLRADSDFHARDRVERSTEQLAEQQRHEREIEALRQSHTAELSHLMATMLEQVDTLQREQAARVTVLQAEIDRLKRMSSMANESSTSGAATQILNEVTSGGDMQTPLRRQ